MESRARSALSSNLDRLKASGVEPVILACKLRIKRIIANEDLTIALDETLPASERLGSLVLATMKNSAKGAFQTFIAVLEEEVDELAKEIKGTFKDCYSLQCVSKINLRS